ncbi:hypothetical protein EGW08_021233 [Elysia chlorotica]|uniref:Uncharacterized protein n=1 Tax=Elysia chlorotica TaxID=188477 RepID=A0A3S0ZBA6_ELYCH|nr:hypothetical protein EGW08_021233 [Elysia chlorotica]
MTEQGPIPKTDTPVTDPPTQEAANHTTEGNPSNNQLESEGSPKRRPYSVAPRHKIGGLILDFGHTPHLKTPTAPQSREPSIDPGQHHQHQSTLKTPAAPQTREPSIDPGQHYQHQSSLKTPTAPQTREPSIDERGALSSLSGTLNASFTGSPRKNSFGPSASQSRRNSLHMDSRKSTMLGSRRSTMLGQAGTPVSVGMLSPDGRRGSFPQGTSDELDPMNSSRSTLATGRSKNTSQTNAKKYKRIPYGHQRQFELA